MKIPPLLRPLLAVCAIAALPSCEGVPGQYGGYPGGGYDDGSGYSSYQSQPTSYYGGGGVYSGSGYYGGSYGRPYYGNTYYGGSRYYRNRYDYDHDHDHRNNNSRYDNNDHRGSSSSSRQKEEAIRLVKVRDGTRGNVPEGYHSKEYYQNRGISLSKNTYETRDGDRRGYTKPSSHSDSNSKPKSSSSSSSKSKSESNSRVKGYGKG